LTNLVDLDLSQIQAGPQSLATLFSPPSLLGKKLQCINLSDTNITASSLKVMLKACPQLTELILDYNEGISPAGVAFIATEMPRLTKLSLDSCVIKNDGFAALATSTTLTNLRHLNLTWNQTYAGLQSIIALINSPIVANLTHLDLTGTNKGPEVLVAIAQSPALSNLQHLKFSNNQTGDKAIIELSQSTTLTSLISLDLGHNHIGPSGFKALCTSPVVAKLTSLNLNYNKDLGNSVATVLAAPSSTLYSLTELHLEETGLRDDAVLQLLATPNLVQLASLKIRYNTMNSRTRALYHARFDAYF
jgi:hypothetical protein